jgi:DNA-binding LacI/PurR family transcriptional regulator
VAGQRSRRSNGAVTILTVAQRAGVSVATVSRVMNGIETVAPELVVRVRAAAAELGYRPNAAAQGLARGSLRSVGVVVPNLANPYFYELLKVIEQRAREDDYRMLVADASEDGAEEYAICEWLCAQVDAIVLCSPRMTDDELARLHTLGTHLVITNRPGEHVGIPSVLVDAAEAVEQLGELVRGHGHRRMHYLAGPSQSWATRERLRLLERLKGISVEVVPSGGSIADGYAAVSEAVVERATVIVGFNDLAALGAMARLAELDVEVPEGISVVGFDDIPFSRYFGPPLTSIRNSHGELGRIAWELVLTQMRAERVPDGSVALPSTLMVRASVGRARRSIP